MVRWPGSLPLDMENVYHLPTFPLHACADFLFKSCVHELCVRARETALLVRYGSETPMMYLCVECPGLLERKAKIFYRPTESINTKCREKIEPTTTTFLPMMHPVVLCLSFRLHFKGYYTKKIFLSSETFLRPPLRDRSSGQVVRSS